MAISRYLNSISCWFGKLSTFLSGICLWFKLRKAVQHFMDARNKTVVRYCETLINANFKGETSNKVDGKTDKNEDEHEVNLGSLLQSMDVEIRELGTNFTGNEERFLEYLHLAIRQRRPSIVDAKEHTDKLLRDKEIFVQLIKTRIGSTSPLHHHSYWGTRQQLRFGKIVGDWIVPNYGQLDPIFGVLLSPTGGRTGPGDDTFLHKLLFDNSGPFAYHSAVHDAFGYLLTRHNTGPGYKYLDAPSFFGKNKPLSEQSAGIMFWRKVLKQDECQKERLCPIF